jgi:hypothetical protein
MAFDQPRVFEARDGLTNSEFTHQNSPSDRLAHQCGLECDFFKDASFFGDVSFFRDVCRSGRARTGTNVLQRRRRGFNPAPCGVTLVHRPTLRDSRSRGVGHDAGQLAKHFAKCNRSGGGDI